MRTYLFLVAFLLGSALIPLRAQLEGKVELLADNQTYLVSVLPDFTLYPGGSTTNNAQITVKIPTGGFVFDGITSIAGNWTLANSVIAPAEEPTFDYYAFSAGGIVGIVYEAGVETQLFTFRNSGTCTGTLELIDNDTDPFMPPNSASVNIGNLMTVIGLGPGNKYSGNTGGGAECPELLMLETTATVATVACHGDSTSIGVSVQGGVAPYALSWVETTTNTTGATTIATQNGAVGITGFFAGEWEFTVNDADSNTASASRTIEQPDPITSADLLIQEASCDGSADGSIDLTVTGGTGPYDYQWSNGQTNNPATALAPADYAVTVTDASGCTLTIDGIGVGAINALSLASMDLLNASCDAAANGSAIVIPANGQAPFSYQWSNGSTDSVAVDLAPADYAVTITDANGCFLIADQLTIGSDNSFSFASAHPVNAGCDGATNGSAAVTTAGGRAPYLHTWSNGSTDSLATGLAPGGYTVTVTDANGCSLVSEVIEVQASGDLSALLIGSDAPNCAESADGILQIQATGGMRPYTYAWTGGAADSIADQLNPGYYGVTVTDAGGCTTTLDSLLLEADGFLTVQATAQAPFCFGDTDAMVSLTTEGNAEPFSYRWAHSATAEGPVLDDITSGTYFYTVTDATGVCAVSDSVFVAAPQRMVIATESTPPTCFGDEDGRLRITEVRHAAPPFLYSLDGFNYAAEANFTGLPGGIYTVFVEDANGCRDALDVLVNEPVRLQIELGEDQTVDLGDDLTLYPAISGAPTTFAWSSTDTLDCDDCPHPTWQPMRPSLVSVTVRDSFGCTATDALRVFVHRPESLYVPSAFSPNGDGHNDAFNIYYGDDVASVRDLVIFDRWGDRVYERNERIPSADPSGNWDGWFRGSPAPAGVYVYRVSVTYIDGSSDTVTGDLTLLR